MNAEPGITTTSLEFLKVKVAEKREAGTELVCAICLDEMAIRQQTIFDQNLAQMIGYISYGYEKHEDRLIAKEAIVFMASGLNEKFRIPIAYHFINSLTADKKAELVEKVLVAMIEIGVKIASITFDGHATNKKMCTILGANLDIYSTSFQPYLVLNEKEKIFIFYDACHMEKLLRGQLDKKQVWINENGDEIKWIYITQLVKYSKERGFSATHKLNQTHIDWRRRPMNVRLAVETLSKSTADSIDFLRSKGYDDFIGATPTVDIILLFDKLFDIFNTKLSHSNENVFKNALCGTNKDSIFTFFTQAIDSIKALKFRCENGGDKYFCKSIAKTGFVGYIINMCSLMLMYTEFVEHLKILTFIPTYYINQDAVEMFFSKIRSLGGFNDNPNVVYFRAAYRKLLANDSILVSSKGNCQPCHIMPNPFSDILFISSRRDKTSEISENDEEIAVLEEVEKLYEKLADLNASASSHLTDDLQNYSIAHIASKIDERIKSTDNCIDCVAVLNDCEKIEHFSLNLNFKQKPCVSTYKICKETDQFLKLQLLKGDINFNTIYYSILNNLEVDQMYIESDFSGHPTHKLYLIRAVVDSYIKIKGVFLAKTANNELHSHKCRFKFSKLIHIYGE